MADDRLRKLVLMLSSDQPGEVAAAAKAIDRTLKVQGRDWNWLAAKLADSEAPEYRPDAAAEPWERREPAPPSEEPRYAEPEQEAPEARTGPWGRPPPPAPEASGRGKQIVAWLGILAVCAVVAPPLADHHGAVALALILIGLILWGCVWLILNATTFWLREIRAVIRWFSRSRA